MLDQHRSGGGAESNELRLKHFFQVLYETMNGNGHETTADLSTRGQVSSFCSPDANVQRN